MNIRKIKCTRQGCRLQPSLSSTSESVKANSRLSFYEPYVQKERRNRKNKIKAKRSFKKVISKSASIKRKTLRALTKRKTKRSTKEQKQIKKTSKKVRKSK